MPHVVPQLQNKYFNGFFFSSWNRTNKLQVYSGSTCRICYVTIMCIFILCYRIKVDLLKVFENWKDKESTEQFYFSYQITILFLVWKLFLKWDTHSTPSPYPTIFIITQGFKLGDNCYLAYRTGQSVDLTVIGNLVFTPSRDLVFPPSRDQRNSGHNGTCLLFRRLAVSVHSISRIKFDNLLTSRW